MNQIKVSFFERFAEIFTWIVMILVLFLIRFLPQKMITEGTVYILIGVIISFILLYYYVICQYFSRQQRLWIKDISDIILIGVLIHLAKDYGIYFFALYFLPIVAAALVLDLLNSLIIAAIACLFIAAEIIISSQGLMNLSEQLLGLWQIGSILLITLFCRFLALQVRQERIAKEEAFVRAKALEEMEKREREFMTMTSHQLFTPLSIIRGFASMLYKGKEGKLTPQQKNASGEIYKNTVRMVDLVAELLSISRIRAEGSRLQLEKIDPVKLTRENINGLEGRAKRKKLSLKLKTADDLPFIYADKEKIRQVLYNLLDNAIKYTQAGEITVIIRPAGNKIVFAVQDTGIGIKPEDREKLFQPFFRGKSILELDNQGTGLGLFIARSIVEKHSGRIWAESTFGKGSTFYFSLPIS